MFSHLIVGAVLSIIFIVWFAKVSFSAKSTIFQLTINVSNGLLLLKFDAFKENTRFILSFESSQSIKSPEISILYCKYFIPTLSYTSSFGKVIFVLLSESDANTEIISGLL